MAYMKTVPLGGFWRLAAPSLVTPALLWEVWEEVALEEVADEVGPSSCPPLSLLFSPVISDKATSK